MQNYFETIGQDHNQIIENFLAFSQVLDAETFTPVSNDVNAKRLLSPLTWDAIHRFRGSLDALFARKDTNGDDALRLVHQLTFIYSKLITEKNYGHMPCSLIEDALFSYLMRFVAEQDAMRFCQGFDKTMDWKVEDILELIPEQKAEELRVLHKYGLWKPTFKKETLTNTLITRNGYEFYTVLNQPSYEFEGLNGCFVDFFIGKARVSCIYAGHFRFNIQTAFNQLTLYIEEKPAAFVDIAISNSESSDGGTENSVSGSETNESYVWSICRIL